MHKEDEFSKAIRYFKVIWNFATVSCKKVIFFTQCLDHIQLAVCSNLYRQ